MTYVYNCMTFFNVGFFLVSTAITVDPTLFPSAVFFPSHEPNILICLAVTPCLCTVAVELSLSLMCNLFCSQVE